MKDKASYEQATIPVTLIKKAHPFHTYLEQYKLLWVTVARASGVTVAVV